MSVGPSVVLDFGDHAHVSRGDGAMLKASIDQLRVMWPEARVGVISSSRTRLRLLDPSVSYLAADRPSRWALSTPQSEWRAPHWALDAWWSASQRVELGYRAKRAWLRATRKVARGSSGEGRRARLDLVPFVPDVVVASGGGYFCDMDAERAHGVLDTLAWAKARGSVVALFSQGIGPVTSEPLRRHMAEVLPTVDMIVVRERLSGPPILRELGVADRLVTVAGDDATLLTGEAADLRARHRIGVSLRSAAYLQLGGRAHHALLAAIAQAAAALEAPLRPVTNCEWGDNDRMPTRELGRLVGRLEPDIAPSAPPQALAEAYRECRVVVTTIYHPALFALAQGVPVVCVCRSAYQRTKFDGLADLFGGEGITILNPDDLTDQAAVRDKILEAWEVAASISPSLTAKAAAIRQQIRGAYEELERRVARGVEDRTAA